MDDFSNVQINFEDIPSASNQVYLPLNRKFATILFVNVFSVFLLSLALLIYLWSAIKKDWFVQTFQWILLGLLLIFLFQFFLIFKGFPFKGYAFREKDLSYKTGWLWRSVTTVPFNRVQHCEVSQGVYDRYFGLAKLKIFTAGGSSSDVTVPGLTLDQATDLKDFILEKIKQDE